jgi:serine/threonine-protein kinase
MDKYIGKRLEGRYEILELTGMGGMSNVYKAHDSIDDRLVAVKILRDEFLDNTEFLRRFKNESKAIAVLSHPNIVRVYDVSFTDSVHSIVMEYIDGITLKDYIERQGLLGWKEAVYFTLQILRALQHAHDKGIVHRDIKPHNIMLLENGDIKVTDFGIARFARSEVPTITDRAIGSVHYISPEQAMGDNTDEKSDIYSVGVMLFEMLTGQLPFEADTAVSVAIKQIQTQAVRPRSLNPDIPEGLEEITVRAMQKDAAKRYQSAAEMIVDIEKFKSDPSIQFAYKYQEQESAEAKQKKIARAITETREEEPMPRRKRTPFIPMLTGVTMAFVLAAASFIGMMVWYNNPFKQVESDPLPDFVGLKYDTVAAQYSDIYEFAPAESEYNDDYGKGIIYEQRPRAGTEVKNGSTVRVTVSLGQREVTLPNFATKDAMQTFAKLRDLGVEYKEERIYSDDAPLGSVVYTDPSKDTVVTSNDIVTVYVSKGPEQQDTDVPSLIGLKVEDAQRMLDLYRLTLGNVSEEVSDQPTGTIIAQDPTPGMIPEGTEVNIVVSKEGIKRVTIAIPLPQVDRTITIRARRTEDNEVLDEATLNPLVDVEGAAVWSPVLAGEDIDEEVLITTYIDGKRYIEYYVNFSKSTFRIGRDRSDAEEFQ